MLNEFVVIISMINSCNHKIVPVIFSQYEAIELLIVRCDPEISRHTFS